MAFGGFSDNDVSRPMAEINMIPLIDVMLVLLVIFIVTAPLLTHAIRVNLPQASAEVNLEKPETITLSIDANGVLYWDQTPVERAALPARLAQAARREPQPQLHLRAERTTQYQDVAQVLAAVQNAGISRVSFVTEPVRP
jgi:biopolymer transport protein ExbD